jgi:EAL domain-containing protein (putative c-di-GMP-specific phosphodiesterase class I)
VRAAGCTQAQGYFYSYPLTANAIMALLTEPAVELRTVA